MPSVSEKNGLGSLIVGSTFLVGINSTSITAASQLINRRFNISDEGFPHSVWPVTAWNTGAAIAPMLALPVMEEYGMRVGYLVRGPSHGRHVSASQRK